MYIGTASTNEEALASLRMLRSHKPYQYGGVWHVAAINGDAYAYRNERDLLKKARKVIGEDAYSGLQYLTVKPA